MVLCVLIVLIVLFVLFVLLVVFVLLVSESNLRVDIKLNFSLSSLSSLSVLSMPSAVGGTLLLRSCRCNSISVNYAAFPSRANKIGAEIRWKSRSNRRRQRDATRR